MLHTGSCHCGNLKLEFSSEIPPAEIGIRECQCDFCRKHGAKAAADSNGKLSILVGNRDHLSRYAFGLRTAEFIICTKCGVFVAAITKGSKPLHGIANVNSFKNRTDFSNNAVVADFSSENEASRMDRRRTNWTPACLIFIDDQ